jgi:integrase
VGKRVKGEGSIYQRKDGRWVAVIPLDGNKKKFFYAKTQREALKELQLANHAKPQGALITTGDQTVTLFLTSWLEDTAQHRVREKTYVRYEELVRLHLLPVIGAVKLQKLAPQHLQRLYRQQREEGYAPQTIQHIHRLLHRALNDTVKWDLVSRNVCDTVDPPRVPKRERFISCRSSWARVASM